MDRGIVWFSARNSNNNWNTCAKETQMLLLLLSLKCFLMKRRHIHCNYCWFRVDFEHIVLLSAVQNVECNKFRCSVYSNERLVFMLSSLITISFKSNVVLLSPFWCLYFCFNVLFALESFDLLPASKVPKSLGEGGICSWMQCCTLLCQ